MNKAQLIEALTVRLGDKKTATAAVDGLVDVIVRSVHKGDKVNITGFGVFEKRARAARTARNPRTGETVRVRKTNVPAFRAGSTFKEVVSGAKKLPRAAAPTRSAASSTTRTSSTRTASTRTASRSAAASRRTTTRTAATSRTRAAASRPATRTAGKTSAKASAGSRMVAKKKATAKAAPKKAVAKVAPKKTVAKAKSVAKKSAPKKGKR